MVITKKIQPNETLRRKIISKGGDIASDSDEYTMVSMRVPTRFLKEIDAEVAKRMGMNRTAWILEAAQEKLKRNDQS